MLTAMRFLRESGDLSTLTKEQLLGFVEEYDMLQQVLWYDGGMQRGNVAEKVKHISEMVRFAVRCVEVELVKRDRDADLADCDCLDPKKSACYFCKVESNAFREEMREADDYMETERDKWAMYNEV